MYVKQFAAELDRWEMNNVILQQHPINSGKLDELFRSTLTKVCDIQKNLNGKNSDRTV